MEQVERQWCDLAHCNADHQQDLHSDIRDGILPDDGTRNWWHGESHKWMEKEWCSYFDQGDAR